ncbi:MAG TPA: hypothetical protein DDZ90_24330, partial [Planctomycetaceae bacterium]|nr:hypothetical protein [Planctomycetaceae bacterium]
MRKRRSPFVIITAKLSFLLGICYCLFYQSLVVSAEPKAVAGWGESRLLDEPITEGVFWVQCQFEPSKDGSSGAFFDLRGKKSNEVIARIAAEPFQRKGSDEKQIRWHSVYTQPDWRLFTFTPFESRAYTLTMRVDLDRKSYACWVDQQTLGEDLPLTSSAAVSQIYLGNADTPDDAAEGGQLVISKTAPKGFEFPRLLP